jgi:uncharacterized protein
MTIRFCPACAFVLTVICATAQAMAAPLQPPRTITVAGHGEVNGTPDSALVSAGVTTQAESAARALADNAASMNRVFAALKSAGVADKNIETSDFSVQPQYANNGDNQKIVGYQVTNQVNVRLDHIANVGATVDTLVSTGANRMNGISFAIRDPKPLLAEARSRAVDDAIAKAQAFATAAHVKLGPILSISEGGTQEARPLFAMQAKFAAAPPPTPVAAGEQSVAADVSIIWQIQ